MRRAALVEQVRSAVHWRHSPAADQSHEGFRYWRWHLDEMYVKVGGEMVYLWRAVDHEDEILQSFVSKSRNTGLRWLS
ncbi:MAG: DDE-type integrase/transposase/recombinase [Sphingobium sp.]|nr:DDE-type integrase/transposase/recombinase [Sphingobium sp.]